MCAIIACEFFFYCFFADRDECQLHGHSCHGKASCTNIHGSYKCSCKAGYQGDGTVCTGQSFPSLVKTNRFLAWHGPTYDWLLKAGIMYITRIKNSLFYSTTAFAYRVQYGRWTFLAIDLSFHQISTSALRRHVKTEEVVRIWKMPFIVFVQAECPVRRAWKVSNAGICNCVYFFLSCHSLPDPLSAWPTSKFLCAACNFGVELRFSSSATKLWRCIVTLCYAILFRFQRVFQ